MRIEILKNDIFQLAAGHAIPPAKFLGDRVKYPINVTQAKARIEKAWFTGIQRAALLIKVVPGVLRLRLCGPDRPTNAHSTISDFTACPVPITYSAQRRTAAARTQVGGFI
jgi:hypothetical protein